MALSDRAAYSKDAHAPYCEFQHRHLATLARMIRKMPLKMRADAAEHFANELGITNDRFDRTRFLCAALELTPDALRVTKMIVAAAQ